LRDSFVGPRLAGPPSIETFCNGGPNMSTEPCSDQNVSQGSRNE
jgi:hypothetical protein